MPPETEFSTDTFIHDLFMNEWSKLVRYAKAQLRKHGSTRVDIDGRAEETVQELFFTAYEKIDEIKNYRQPENWLYVALNYKIKETLREDNKWFRSIDLFDEGMIQSPKIPENTLSDLLPAEDYLLLRQVYHFGYTYEELAQFWGVTKPALGMRIYRIKKSFREKYKEFLQ